MSPLERELEAALLERYETWKEIGYSAVYFKRMLTPKDRIYRDQSAPSSISLERI